ncbi:MAG TPA: hypothetical protein DCG85_02575 [Lachnospiraceae bacterium]|nr:hypothetical protein [Lachnospiraceae bacterium]
MIKITEITNDNVSGFEDILGEDLTDDLNRTFYKGIVALDGDDPVGAMVYELFGVDSETEDVISRIRLIESRDEEVWSSLLDGYRSAAGEFGIAKTVFETSDENAAALFESRGFTCEKKKSEDLIVKVRDLKKARLKLNTRIPAYCTGIADISFLQFKNAIRSFLFKGIKGSVPDMAYLSMNWFDEDVSSCCLADGNDNGMLLVRRTPSGILKVILFTCLGPGSKQNLAYMLIRSVNMALEMYTLDTRVMINCRSKEVLNLVSHILPGHERSEVYVLSRKESENET